MSRLRYALASLALLVPALAHAQDAVFAKTVKGTPELKSIEAISFGPGVMLLGDGRGSQIVAVKMPTAPAKAKWTTGEMPGIKDKLAERLGTTAKGIELIKMAVDPQSGLACIIVRKTDGKKDFILTVNAEGKIAEFPLENVEYARVALPPGEKANVTKITDVAWGGKSILVAAQANETFGSKVLVIPAPITHDAKGILFSTETYHVAHNRWETNAPIRTIMPYEEKGKNYLVGAFTCTPIVKYSIDELQPNSRVKGESVIEIGNGNEPKDMFSYQKDGKSYILMSTFRFFHAKNPIGPSPYWTVKVDQGILTETEKINEKAIRRVSAKVPASELAVVVPAFSGVMLMDRLDTERALVVKTDGKDGISLAVLPLP